MGKVLADLWKGDEVAREVRGEEDDDKDDVIKHKVFNKHTCRASFEPPTFD
jgi:hypothetical protein